MLFKEYHIPMIRSGSKTVTRREWADNYPGPNVGTVVAAKTDLLKPDEKCDCFIKITGKREEYLGEITDYSASREGDYDGIEDFKEGYEEVYGEGSWDNSKQVTVVEFEYVGEQRPGENNSEQTTLADGGTARPGHEVKHAHDRPKGTVQARKINRNALRASLHERGFIGVNLTMHNRDYALVDLSEVPEPRQEVARAYFESWDAAFRESDAEGFGWGVRI